MSSDDLVTGIPGDPGQLTGFSQILREAGERLGLFETQVAHSGLESWQGSGADSFRAALGDFSPRLGTVANAFLSASTSVGAFARQLSEHQSNYAVVHASISANRSTSLLHRVGAWAEHEADDLEHDFTRLVSEAESILQEWENDARQCVLDVTEAAVALGALGYGSVARAFTTVAKDGLHDMEMAADEVQHVVSDGVQWVDKHWNTIETVLEVTCVVLSVAAFVAAQFVPGLDVAVDSAGLAEAAGGAEAADGVLTTAESISNGLDFASKTADALQLAGNTFEFAQGNESVEDEAFSVVGGGLDAADLALPVDSLASTVVSAAGLFNMDAGLAYDDVSGLTSPANPGATVDAARTSVPDLSAASLPVFSAPIDRSQIVTVVNLQPAVAP